MGSYKISKTELKSLGLLPGTGGALFGRAQSAGKGKGKGNGVAKQRRAKKVAKRRVGKKTTSVAPVAAAGDDDDDDDDDDVDVDVDVDDNEEEYGDEQEDDMEEGDDDEGEVETQDDGAPEVIVIEDDGSPDVAVDVNDTPSPIAEDEAAQSGDPEQPQIGEEQANDEVDEAIDYYPKPYYRSDSPPWGDEVETQVSDMNEPAPASLSELKLSVAKWRRLEQTSRDTVPRFLFRHFTPASGGGYEGLNGKDGVKPHAFLQGKAKEPTTIYDIPEIQDMINGHLSGCTLITTEFSSWAADLSWTMSYMPDEFPNCSIAIIDTTLLASHVKVYHTHNLMMAGLSCTEYSYEYLVYGPISGPAYHCVEMVDIPKKHLDTFKSFVWKTDQVLPAPALTLATSHLSTEEITMAKDIATLFRRPDDERPDVIVAMTAAFLCLPDRWRITETLDDHSWVLIQAHLADELKSLRLPVTMAGVQGLANPKIRVKDHPKLQETINLLMTIEAKVKDLREMQAEMSRPGPSGTQASEARSSNYPGESEEDDESENAKMNEGGA